MSRSDEVPRALLERLLRAVNDHDLDALVSCFSEDYVNETPVHPLRGFSGRDQVRKNWTQIFTGVPDVRAEVPRAAVEDDTLWTEWDLSGSRSDGEAFHLRGVVIFGVARGHITSASFYLEPVEHATGDVDAATVRLVGTTKESS
jgi:ketosteroid isomerase-like protein